MSVANAARKGPSHDEIRSVPRAWQPGGGFHHEGGLVVQVTDSMRQYWSKNLAITAVLLFIWFVVTYVASFYARELNEITFLGFPLGFYMGAQGSLVVYVLIIAFYAGYMNRLDRKYGVHEEE